MSHPPIDLAALVAAWLACLSNCELRDHLPGKKHPMREPEA